MARIVLYSFCCSGFLCESARGVISPAVQPWIPRGRTVDQARLAGRCDRPTGGARGPQAAVMWRVRVPRQKARALAPATPGPVRITFKPDSSEQMGNRGSAFRWLSGQNEQDVGLKIERIFARSNKSLAAIHVQMQNFLTCPVIRYLRGPADGLGGQPAAPGSALDQTRARLDRKRVREGLNRTFGKLQS